MPTYEYACETCGRFEAFQSITAPALAACPTCGGAVRRLISKGGGVIFKGSGFYETDYRSAEYKEKAKAESGPAKTPDAKPSETKAAGAEAAKPTPAAGSAAPAAPAASGSSGSSGSSSTSTSGPAPATGGTTPSSS